MSDSAPKLNIKLTIAYLGTSYAGWQKAHPAPSIEETLEKALSKILQHEVKLQAASRTDAGVHAEGQVVNFFTQNQIVNQLPKSTVVFRLNSCLPKDIAVTSAEEMPANFHPSLDCIKKEYWYHICNSLTQLPFHRQTSWHIPYPLNKEAMRKAANYLIGTHDFSAFCKDRRLWNRNPVCHLEKIEIEDLSHQRLRISLTGDHFLFRMARNIVGTLLHVGCGKIDAEVVPSILSSLDRTQAGVTAPAPGLSLKRVFYKE